MQDPHRVDLCLQLRQLVVELGGQEKGSLRTAVVAERIDFLTPKRKEAATPDQAGPEPAVETPRPVATAARERRP